MKRKVFDVIVSATGIGIAVLLLVAGGLLTWASTFIGNQVHDQLAAQQIYFPAANSKAVSGPEFAAMRQYGGQQLTTGDQAEVYADHFIAVHLAAAGGGKTYAQLSSAAQADPTNTKLAAQVETMFKGETLRGLLLNAYAFGKVAQVANIASWVAYGFGVVLLGLGALGFAHAESVGGRKELLGGDGSGHQRQGRMSAA